MDTTIDLLKLGLLVALFTTMTGVALVEVTFAVTRKWRKVREEGR